MFIAVRQTWRGRIPVQFVKFCIVGGSGYVINLVVYALLLRGLEIPYALASVGAFTLAATNNYTWNRLWTFGGAGGHVALQGTQFLVVAALALGANLLLLRVLVGLGFDPLVGQAIAIILVTPLNFLGNKFWTFKRRSAGPHRTTQPAPRMMPREDHAAALSESRHRRSGDPAPQADPRSTAPPLAPTTVPEAS